MTREEAIQYLKDHYDSVDGGNADWILDKDAEKLINRIYDEIEKSEVKRFAVEIIDKVYDTIGPEAYSDLANDNFYGWLLEEED